MADITITLPNGTEVNGSDPIVVIGPNGSGKTRQTREMRAVREIGFVNALRNTRVAAELPAMGFDTARSNYDSQRQQARQQHWELSSEFDFMLSNLLAQDSMVAKQYADRARESGVPTDLPPDTPLSRVERLWREVFTGRALTWRDWKPVVVSTTRGVGTVEEYSGNFMSDGEKAALFLLGRVMSADAGVLVIDEPETHFHSLLAVRLWNALERARPDIRFVYVTHDLTFAISRREPRFVLASPTDGLRAIEVDSDLPTDVAAALLGSASLSFYASRIVFCEGIEGGYDSDLFKAWFSGPDTEVRAVEDCQTVLRCVTALNESKITHSLEVRGLTDSDYHSDEFIRALPSGAGALPVHEIESLYALPEIVEAVAAHNAAPFDLDDYVTAVMDSVNEVQRHSIVIQRWKERVEGLLVGVVAQVSRRRESLDSLVAEMPAIFEKANWSFSPEEILANEKERVERAFLTRDADELFLLVPGKQLFPIAARFAGLDAKAYRNLVINALNVEDGAPQQGLRDRLVAVLELRLPPRTAAVAAVAA